MSAMFLILYSTATPSHKRPSCKSPVRQFSLNCIGCVHLVAVTGLKWLLRGLGPALFHKNDFAWLLQDRLHKGVTIALGMV